MTLVEAASPKMMLPKTYVLCKSGSKEILSLRSYSFEFERNLKLMSLVEAASPKMMLPILRYPDVCKFGSKSKGKLSLQSYSFQFETNPKLMFLVVAASPEMMPREKFPGTD